jgi:prolyl-tRNA synthetase
LILPPKLAPIQVVIVPIYRSDEEFERISVVAAELVRKLKVKNISVKYDNRDTQRPGFKFAEYELKGVPVRLAIGGRDLENGTIEIARRDTQEKHTITRENLDEHIEKLLEEIQASIYNKALAFRDQNIRKVNSYEEFKQILDDKGGFISAHWDGTADTEKKIKEETKATIRCIPLVNEQEEGICIFSGKPSSQRVLFARAY